MRTLLLTLLILPVNLVAAEIEPFTAEYKIRFKGLGGNAVTTLSQGAEGTYVLENRTRAKGLARLAMPNTAVERSEFVILNNQPQPVAFVSEDGSRRNKRGSTITFDWSGGNASTTYKGETKSLELESGMLDRQVLQIAMMSDLSDGLTSASYTIIDRHSLKTYHFSVVGEERIEVPAGDFEVVKLKREREGSSRSSIMWCAPSLNYLTVRMQQFKEGKVIGTLELTDID